MTHNIYIYILIMGGISYFIRVLPMTLIRKPLKNQFLQSFLYYVPYVTLAVMTFPAILHATQSPISGSPRSRCWSCGRMVRCRTAASRSSLLRSCIYCRAFLVE